MPINVSCHDLQEKNFAIIEINRLAVTNKDIGMGNGSENGNFPLLYVHMFCSNNCATEINVFLKY